MSSKFKVAVVQAAPVLFDLENSLKKVAELTREAAKQNAQLVLFPEAFLSAYPRGLSFGTVVGSRTMEGRETWLRFWESAVEVPGKATTILGEIARDNSIYLAIGVNERDKVSGTIYCTLLYFSPEGKLMGKHRKLKPTAAERIIWGEGDGDTLSTFETPLARIGGLICWENYMPLARAAMYQKGVQLYLAPTADNRDTWQHTLQHIAHEGGCFVLGSNQYVTKSMYPKGLPGLTDLENLPEILSRGGSVIVSPKGEILAGPLWGKEGIITAEVDLDDIIRAKLDFDAIGHYARNDIFTLTVKDQPETVIDYHKPKK